SALTAALGTNVNILQARSSFSANYSATLSGGGDKLTLADLNVEAANSQALTLRQQIGIQSLSVTGTQNSSILSLLR
ncbi:MAG TPA: flagellin-like protein, partial [Aliidongia sp.]|nr:flagellin-like protein [Aliidongia sp.]